MEQGNSYEFKIRILGNEIFAVGISANSTSKTWVFIALVSIFSLLTVVGAYGEKFIALYNSLVS